MCPGERSLICFSLSLFSLSFSSLSLSLSLSLIYIHVYIYICLRLSARFLCRSRACLQALPLPFQEAGGSIGQMCKLFEETFLHILHSKPATNKQLEVRVYGERKRECVCVRERDWVRRGARERGRWRGARERKHFCTSYAQISSSRLRCVCVYSRSLLPVQ